MGSLESESDPCRELDSLIDDLKLLVSHKHALSAEHCRSLEKVRDLLDLEEPDPQLSKQPIKRDETRDLNVSGSPEMLKQPDPRPEQKQPIERDELQELKLRVDMLTSQNNRLERQLNAAEQYARRNNIVITGIPVVEKENLREIVSQVAKALDIKLYTCNIDGAYRSRDPNPSIIVKLNSAELKKDIIRKSKIVKLKGTDLNFSSTQRIVIGDHLTKATSAALKKLKNSNEDGTGNNPYTTNTLKQVSDVLEEMCSLGKRQINSLAKIVEYSEDETLVEEKQNQLKKDCMDAWEIPIKARREPSREQPEFLCRKLLENDSSFLRQTPKNILTVDMCESLYTVYDWHAVILGSNREATFYLCASHRKCYRYETASGKWVPVSPINECGLELSPETLVYGEIVPEVIGTFRGQRKINVFHIIDGYMLGGKNISQLDYTERIIECSVYAKALTRPSLLKVMPIRMKTVFDLERIEDDAFCKMDDITMKNGRTRLAVPVYDAHNAEQFFLPKGIMFLRATKLPYRRFYSTTNNMKYYWAPKQKALFDKDRPTESIASFKDSYSGAFTWYMNEEEDSKFNRQEFVKELVHYVRTKKNFKKDEK